MTPADKHSNLKLAEKLRDRVHSFAGIFPEVNRRIQDEKLLLDAAAAIETLEKVLQFTRRRKEVGGYTALKARLRKVEEALAFYADPVSWQPVDLDWLGIGNPGPVHKDQGKRAQEALNAGKRTTMEE